MIFNPKIQWYILTIPCFMIRLSCWIPRYYLALFGQVPWTWSMPWMWLCVQDGFRWLWRCSPPLKSCWSQPLTKNEKRTRKGSHTIDYYYIYYLLLFLLFILPSSFFFFTIISIKPVFILLSSLLLLLLGYMISDDIMGSLRLEGWVSLVLLYFYSVNTVLSTL
jgi:hypothetical protein